MQQTIPYTVKILGTISAALISVPTIAAGFYTIYQLVTFLGN